MNWIKQNKSFLASGLIIMAIISYFLYPFIRLGSQNEKGEITARGEAENELLPANAPKVAQEEETVQENEAIMVDVKGAVNHPGVYEANERERIIDVIKRAGGIKDKGEESAINLALKVTDEMVIYVPYKGEENPQAISTDPDKGSAAVDGSPSNLVDLNSATPEDLETLPGIGPAKAEMIIEFRDSNGGFSTKEDLKKISGIGEKTFEKLSEYVTVK
ncbi:helix-hairpin-helix domain-containing protein [Niallia sp. 03133]|uniref:helix-hairpin-helix domain-containing protein n=1 Tax=Niallia sp. 03133 TaxID=3458060 RepID=UPI004044FCA0